MNRVQTVIALAIAIGMSVAIRGQNHEDGEKVRVISMHEMREKLDGEKTKATIVEVTIAPGKSGLAHRHPGPALVYVLEGEYELGIDDDPTKRFKAGETFYEPAGCLHRVSKNPSAVQQTRLIAVVLHPHNAHDIAVPVESHD